MPTLLQKGPYIHPVDAPRVGSDCVGFTGLEEVAVWVKPAGGVAVVELVHEALAVLSHIRVVLAWVVTLPRLQVVQLGWCECDAQVCDSALGLGW